MKRWEEMEEKKKLFEAEFGSVVYGGESPVAVSRWGQISFPYLTAIFCFLRVFYAGDWIFRLPAIEGGVGQYRLMWWFDLSFIVYGST